MNEIFIYSYDSYLGLRKERVEVLKEMAQTLKLPYNNTCMFRISKDDLNTRLTRGTSIHFFMTSEDDKFVKDKIIEHLNNKIEVYKNKIQKCEETISEIQIQDIVTE